MRVVQLTATSDADGVLRLAIPAGGAAGRFEVAVVLTPLPGTNGTHQRAIHPGYPPGWERVYGSIQDETFVEPPDLPVTPVEPLG